MTNPIAFNASLQRPTELETIKEALRIAQEVHDEPRDLHFFERVYLTEFRAISDRYTQACGSARRDPAMTEEGRDILCRLALRTEAREMGEALRAYRDERTRFFNDQCDEVAVAMSEAAE